MGDRPWRHAAAGGPPRGLRWLVRFTNAARGSRSWIAASWRNVATVGLVGLAAAVSSAAGWDQRHHVQWLVAAAVIVALAGLAQLSRGTRQAQQEARPRLGAWPSADHKGTDFAVFSESADGVDLCLFEHDGHERRITLTKTADHVWHGSVPGVGPGQRYGYRVKGPYDPVGGHRFNPAKLLLDPYARAIEGEVDWDGPVFGYVLDGDENVADLRDSAPYVPRSVVVDDSFDWGDDRRLHIPWHDTVIYQAHVRGLTKQWPGISAHQRGTYAAMGSAPVISYLRNLGVTSLLLMTVNHFVSERELVQRGRSNYWGYMPIGYFAPEASYSSAGAAGEQVGEFKTMVRNLHAAGIEVIIDMAYSHTAEGNHRGPHLCFRGIDNRAYYRLLTDDRHYYEDYSGCGNSLNAGHQRVLSLIMDGLRYWVTEMHVDGFRFDLPSALARNFYEAGTLDRFSPNAHEASTRDTLFGLIRKDPIISQVKLIAESWDVGESGGYQVETFPVQWAEFNDDYRDALRDFWRGVPQPRKRLAYRLTGSIDICRSDGRSPGTSINFVTSQDGFTLYDLVSYNEKHNEDNGEDNRDGLKDDRSWNCGTEGPTNDPAITRLRSRQKRNFLTSLFLSAGVPALLSGDEINRTQRGNNNPYCQDNTVSWIDWKLDDEANALLQFTKQLLALRAAHPVFRRRKSFQGQEIGHTGTKDIGWFTSDAAEIDECTWRTPDFYALGMFLNGQAVFDRTTSSERVSDDSFMLLFNGGNASVRFTLPGLPWATSYKPIINTDIAVTERNDDAIAYDLKAGETIQLTAHSMAVLRAI